jgi:hypothetical protein
MKRGRRWGKTHRIGTTSFPACLQSGNINVSERFALVVKHTTEHLELSIHIGQP